MEIIKGANLALAFVLEVCMLVALGYWGFRVGPEPLWNLVLGIGAPLLAGMMWGLFVAPNAVVKVSPVVRQTLKVVIFGVAVGALFAAGQPTLGAVLGVLFVINFALLLVWEQ